MKTGVEASILQKIFKLYSLKEQIKVWKKQGYKIVFTNGVFDILHVGHISYLAKASELGNKLILGVNANDSVKRLKGPTRPVNDQGCRAMILASLFFVDAVVIFEEDTPLDLIVNLKPDILVKGADYSIDKIVGAKEVISNGGSVKTIYFVDGFSSSFIIKKIQDITT
jgi:rfaE bifunctional protein nucleotidyltransferase chain/domain